jgi:hypothetical protein
MKQISSGKGTVKFSGARYLLFRGSALSNLFFMNARLLHGNSYIGTQGSLEGILRDIGATLALSDLKTLSNKFDMRRDMDKLAICGTQLAFSGFGTPSFLHNTEFSRTVSHLIVELQSSFEAESWGNQNQQKPDHESTCYCLLASSYLSTSFQEITKASSARAVEVYCKMKGDPTCTFLVAADNNFSKVLDECAEKLQMTQEQKRRLQFTVTKKSVQSEVLGDIGKETCI